MWGQYPRGYGEAAHDWPWTAIRDGLAGSKNVFQRLLRALLMVQVPPWVSNMTINLGFLDKAFIGENRLSPADTQYEMLPRLESIRVMRKKLGVTQKELARKCDISASMINQIESGRSKPGYDTAKRIFDELVSMESRDHSQKAGTLCSEEIVQLGVQDTLLDAVKRMRQHSISQIPVFSDGDPVGVITEDGIVRHLASEDEEGLRHTRLADAMEPCPPIVDHDTPSVVLVPLIRYSKCILVSKESTIIGIITASDTLKMME